MNTAWSNACVQHMLPTDTIIINTNTFSIPSSPSSSLPSSLSPSPLYSSTSHHHHQHQPHHQHNHRHYEYFYLLGNIYLFICKRLSNGFRIKFKKKRKDKYVLSRKLTEVPGSNSLLFRGLCHLYLGNTRSWNKGLVLEMVVVSFLARVAQGAVEEGGCRKTQ